MLLQQFIKNIGEKLMKLYRLVAISFEQGYETPEY